MSYMLTSSKPFGLTNAQLKLIAIVTMLIDHCGLTIVYYGFLCSNSSFSLTHQDILWNVYHIMRDIGRTAFPIFLFLLVQGFIHTHDRGAYAKRLFLFAILSEIPFDLCVAQNVFSTSYQNVMWTLLLGFLLMCGLDRVSQKEFPEIIRFLLSIVLIAIFCGIAFWLKTDYSYKGVLIVAVLYFVRFDKRMTIIAIIVCFLWEPAAIFAVVPIAFYNKQKGHMGKKFFYWFYPMHLLCLYVLQRILPIVLL